MLCCFEMEGLPLATRTMGLPREVILNLQIQLIYLFIYLFIFSTFAEKDLALEFTGWPGILI